MSIASVAALCNMALGYAGVNKFINDISGSSASAQACSVYYDAYRRKVLGKYAWRWATRRAALTVFTGVAWDSTGATTYQPGAMITFGSVIFRCLVAIKSATQPPLDPAHWFQVTRDGWAFAAPPPADMIRGLEAYEKPTLSPTGTPLTWQVQPPPPLRAMRSDQRPSFDVEDANDGSGTEIIVTDLDQPVLKYTANITNPQSFSDPFIEALAWTLAPSLSMALTADVKRAQGIEMKAIKEIREAIADEMRSVRLDPEPVSEFEAAREN